MKPKKMSDEEQVYEELGKVLNETPFSAPRTPSIMKVLKYFFPTVEDAKVAKHVPPLRGRVGYRLWGMRS